MAKTHDGEDVGRLEPLWRRALWIPSWPQFRVRKRDSHLRTVAQWPDVETAPSPGGHGDAPVLGDPRRVHTFEHQVENECGTLVALAQQTAQGRP
jgi:hypothetical protein